MLSTNAAAQHSTVEDEWLLDVTGEKGLRRRAISADDCRDCLARGEQNNWDTKIAEKSIYLHED